MELLCPNCQQRVTVADHLAGQVMKCPHCNNTFTTPSLAPATTAAFVPPPAPVPPVQAQPAVVAPATVEPAPSVPAAPPAPVTGDYRHRLGISLSPRVLPWIAVAALVIVFILTFFSWAGYFPGGYAVVTQNAWQAAFGSSSYGANGLLILFLLLFLIALLGALLAAIEGWFSLRLPSALERLRPWRWVIVSAITFLAFVFLVLQLLSGVSLVKDIRDNLERSKAAAGGSVQVVQIHIQGLDELAKAAGLNADRSAEIEIALHMSAARYTSYLWASVWLTALAAVCAVLTYFLSRRVARPMPRLELMW